MAALDTVKESTDGGVVGEGKSNPNDGSNNALRLALCGVGDTASARQVLYCVRISSEIQGSHRATLTKMPTTTSMLRLGWRNQSMGQI